MKAGVVSSKELGTNCWLPARFIEGGRCLRWEDCKYPEKANCKAREWEIENVRNRITANSEEYFELHKRLVKLWLKED